MNLTEGQRVYGKDKKEGGLGMVRKGNGARACDGTHPRRQKKWWQSEAIGKRQTLRKTGFMSPTAHRTTYLDTSA